MLDIWQGTYGKAAQRSSFLGFGESFAFAARLAARRSSFLPIIVATIVLTTRTMIIKNNTSFVAARDHTDSIQTTQTGSCHVPTQVYMYVI